MNKWDVDARKAQKIIGFNELARSSGIRICTGQFTNGSILNGIHNKPFLEWGLGSEDIICGFLSWYLTNRGWV